MKLLQQKPAFSIYLSCLLIFIFFKCTKIDITEYEHYLKKDNFQLKFYASFDSNSVQIAGYPNFFTIEILNDYAHISLKDETESRLFSYNIDITTQKADEILQQYIKLLKTFIAQGRQRKNSDLLLQLSDKHDLMSGAKLTMTPWDYKARKYRKLYVELLDSIFSLCYIPSSKIILSCDTSHNNTNVSKTNFSTEEIKKNWQTSTNNYFKSCLLQTKYTGIKESDFSVQSATDLFNKIYLHILDSQLDSALQYCTPKNSEINWKIHSITAYSSLVGKKTIDSLYFPLKAKYTSLTINGKTATLEPGSSAPPIYSDRLPVYFVLRKGVWYFHGSSLPSNYFVETFSL